MNLEQILIQIILQACGRNTMMQLYILSYITVYSTPTPNLDSSQISGTQFLLHQR